MCRTNEIKFEFDGLKFSIKTTYHENGELNTIQTYLDNGGVIVRE
jgi:hypothetical protein